MNILGKKILLIAPVFFDYYKEIQKTLEANGAVVQYVCDAPSNTNLSKALGRINKRFIMKSTERYYTSTVKPIVQKQKFDYVLVIGGMTFAFSPKMVGEIRELQKKAKFILYQWDSERNLPYSTHIHPFFDAIWTFDRHDAQNADKYHFLPLFYIAQYEQIGSIKPETWKYDCMYVGTAHPQKYKEINEIRDALLPYSKRLFIYHYMPSKLKFLYHKVTAKEFREARIEDFQLQKLGSEKLKDIMTNSRCVLDAPQAGQTGLTIRTIECLGAKRKLITTNKEVRLYDFYDPQDIFVFEGSVDGISDFFASDYKEIPVEIYKKYSITGWLDTMLG